MNKKITALIIALALLLSITPVFAKKSTTAKIINGDFETLTEQNVPYGWSFINASPGKHIFADTEVVKNGTYSLKTIRGDGVCIVSQGISSGISAGQMYDLSVWANNVGLGNSVSFKVEYYDNFTMSTGKIIEEKRIGFGQEQGWQERVYSFTVPDGCKLIVVYLCNYSEKGTVVNFDNITLNKTGVATGYKDISEETPKEIPLELKKPIEGTGELIKNGGIENGNADWSVNGGWENNKTISITDEYVHGGKKAVMVNALSGGNHWIRQGVQNIISGAEYQLSAWMDFDDVSGTVALRFEYYSDNVMNSDTYLGSFGSDPVKPGGYAWKHLGHTFNAPEGTKMLMVYIRIMGTGVAYFDDISMVQTAKPAYAKMNTDWTFYYSDWDYGEATVSVNIKDYPELQNGSAKFSIMDGSKALTEEIKPVSSDGQLSFKFKVSDLVEKQKEYAASSWIYDKDGNVLQTLSRRIFRYDRPKYLREDGYFEKDGKVLNPVVTMGVPKESMYPDVATLGTSIVTVYSDATKERLDKVQELGMKAVILMYRDMKPAGHPDNIEYTKQKVAELKDHPALFAWSIMDEPFYNYADPTDWMIDSYKAVRDIDPNHPVYLVEIERTKFKEAVKYCDVFITDIYPAATDDKIGYVNDRLEAALEAGQYKRTIYSTMQAFTYQGYTPTYNDERNFIYQSFFCGAPGTGYYQFQVAANGENLDKTEMGRGIKDFYNLEQEDTFKHFIYGEYPIFNEYRGEDYWYRGYIKDGKLRAVILNRTNKEATKADIKLESLDGSISIGDFTGAAYAGGSGSVSGNGTLSVTLEPGQAVVYEIVPSGTVDFSGLTGAKYVDLYNYPWARVQIEALREKNIVNSETGLNMTFEPGKNITRGDLAYFLIRTLNLKSESTDNFDDVDKDSYYAKEIAAGKALGILNGVGNNKFNPEEEISRQDLMTIIARGMKLTGETDLSVFSDSSLITEYAVPYVRAMISSGLIKGNADGTLNPIGKATRAEAAVIMYRILKN